MKREFRGLRCMGMALATVLCLSLLGTTAAQAQPHSAATAAPALKLAIAGGTYYTTDLAFSAPAGATGTTDVSLSQCQVGIMHLPPNGSRYIEDATNTFFCGNQRDYYLIDAPAAPSFTMLSFHSGSSASSYRVPALGAVTADRPSTIGMNAETLTNTDRQQTRVLCGFDGSEGSIEVEVHGPNAELLGTETVRCTAPVTLATLKTRFQSGYVVVRAANPGFGTPCFTSCSAGGSPIYGAVVVSTPANGNARLYAFGQ